MKYSFLIFIFVALVPLQSFAQDSLQGFRTTNLPLPRYVSLTSDKVYVRTGPALRYPIKWVYKRENLPVEIIQEFDVWRKVRDYEGEEGWIHQSLLSGERTVLIDSIGIVPMREGFSHDSDMVARLEPMVVASLDKCTDDWCHLESHGYKGWVERKYIWGIYGDEELN